MSRPQTVFQLYPNPKNSSLGPKKSKMTPTLSQNQMQMSEFKESYKMTVVKLHELTPKQFLSPTLNQKQPNRAPKSQSNPKIKSELKETKKMKIIALYKQTPKQFEPDPNPQNILNHNPTPMKAQFLPLFNVNLSQLNFN